MRQTDFDEIKPYIVIQARARMAEGLDPAAPPVLLRSMRRVLEILAEQAAYYHQHPDEVEAGEWVPTADACVGFGEAVDLLAARVEGGAR